MFLLTVKFLIIFIINFILNAKFFFYVFIIKIKLFVSRMLNNFWDIIILLSFIL